MGIFFSLLSRSSVVVVNQLYPIDILQQTIFTDIVNSVKGQETLTPSNFGIYDSSRCKKYGPCAASYSGWKWTNEMVSIAADTAQRLLPESKVTITFKHEYAAQQLQDHESAITGHSYVCVDDGQLIIDPLYRNLLMVHRGNVSKWFSPYAEHIYQQLPPVFVGTKEQMQQLYDTLEEQRQLDPEHNKDDLKDVMRWYREPTKSFSIYS